MQNSRIIKHLKTGPPIKKHANFIQLEIKRRKIRRLCLHTKPTQGQEQVQDAEQDDLD